MKSYTYIYFLFLILFHSGNFCSESLFQLLKIFGKSAQKLFGSIHATLHAMNLNAKYKIIAQAIVLLFCSNGRFYIKYLNRKCHILIRTLKKAG